MTRDAEHTPSPQSVVVPVEPLTEMRAAAGYLRNAKIDLETGAPKATAIRTIEGGLKRLEGAIDAFADDGKAIKAAPAPSSLAGGEVDERLHGAIGKLKAWVDLIQHGKRGEPVSGNPIVDCVNDLPAIVRELEAAELEIEGAFERYEDAALSPEAPARVRVDAHQTVGPIDYDKLRSIIHSATNAVLPFANAPMKTPFSTQERAGMQVEIADLIVADLEKAGGRTPALTPIHEAPANSCASHRSMGIHIDPCCPHCEAPAEGAGEIGAEYDTAAHCLTLAECPPGLFLWNGSLGFKSEYGAMEPDDATNGKHWKVGNRADAYCADSGEYFWGGATNHDDRAKLLVYPVAAETVAMVASHGPAALRARSSAPEAREEALGNLLAVIHGDGGHRALEVGTKQAALEAEKIVAGLFAAPSADKRRIAVEALEPFANLGVSSGPDDEPCHYAYRITRGAIRNARQALAALKAEG